MVNIISEACLREQFWARVGGGGIERLMILSREIIDYSKDIVSYFYYKNKKLISTSYNGHKIYRNINSSSLGNIINWLVYIKSVQGVLFDSQMHIKYRKF